MDNRVGGNSINLNSALPGNVSADVKLFEESMLSHGLRTEQSESGTYISELTQAAWVGYLLGITCTREELSPETDVMAKPDDPGMSSGTVPAVVIPRLSKEVSERFNPEDFDHLKEENSEVTKRYFKKILHENKKAATRHATEVSRRRCIPMWVHRAVNEDGWHVSSHGFAIPRRPDVLVTMSQLDKKQLEMGLKPSLYARDIQPSAIIRVANCGQNFQQNGITFSEVVLLEWLSLQEDPALVMSVEAASNTERNERIRDFQEVLRSDLGYSSYYRWITHDTALFALTDDLYDHSVARDRVNNPHWVLKSMSWPNTFILKERKNVV